MTPPACVFVLIVPGHVFSLCGLSQAVTGKKKWICLENIVGKLFFISIEFILSIHDKATAHCESFCRLITEAS